MPRRVNLPAADDIFRATDEADKTAGKRAVRVVPDPAPDESLAKRPSGRIRHDEKVTVYVTSQELLDIEHARLSLRRHQGLAVDRGRLVREAIAMALADLEANGDDSALVQRLTGA